MSISETNKIDALAVSQDGEALMLLIADHLPWDDEHTHLVVLQDKLNAYMSYIQSGDWKQQVQQNVKYAIIEIHFKHDITENCEKFLQSVQNLFGPHGVKIKAVIA